MAAATIWGWDNTNKQWVKFAVNADGVLEVSMAVTNLDDLADVYVPSPTDGYILYWDEAATKWKCRALTDSDIPATIARDTEVATAVSNHAAIAAAHHAVFTTTEHTAIGNGAPHHAEAHTLASHTTKAHSELTGIGGSDHHSNVITITFIIDGGGSAITTGQKGHLEIPFACTLTGWTLAADQAGAIVIDVWKDTYANFPPTDADAMPGAGKEPTIAATNQKAQDTDISDWTTVAIAAGSVLAFNVDSCTTITRVTLSLKAVKT